jgi:hypothetical protein
MGQCFLCRAMRAVARSGAVRRFPQRCSFSYSARFYCPRGHFLTCSMDKTVQVKALASGTCVARFNFCFMALVSQGGWIAWVGGNFDAPLFLPLREAADIGDFREPRRAASLCYNCPSCAGRSRRVAMTVLMPVQNIVFRFMNP